MKTFESRLPPGEILEIKRQIDGSYKVVQQELNSSSERTIGTFSIPISPYRYIDVENISMNDIFMEHIPATESERETRQLIKEVIKRRVKSFFVPIVSPSYAEGSDEKIVFVLNGRPIVNKSYEWWETAAKQVDPLHQSRLGTKLEYGAFLAVLIKQLIEEGKSVERAWHIVCNNSKSIGHYKNSSDAQGRMITTGSRGACGFYDLGNVRKILADDMPASQYFWKAGGEWSSEGNSAPLAWILKSNIMLSQGIPNATGWIVFS